MTAFLHHLAYDFKTGIRDRSKLLMFYLFPIVFFVLVGGLMSSLNPGFKQTMIPGMVLFAFMCAALLNLPALLVNAREAGVFRSYRINGVPSASVLSIPVISTAVHMAVVALLITLAGMRFYGGVAPSHAAGFVAAALMSYAMYAGIGALLGVAAGNNTVSILVGQLIYIPSIILGGLMVPSSILPAGLRKLSLLLPATHSMRVFGGLGMPGSAGTPWLSIGVLAASIVVSFGLAALLFEWDSRAQAPSRKAWAALLAIVPFAAAALIGAA
jgi:ABC-2 type transport system permease protein